MKLVTAFIKPFKLDDVKDALKAAGINPIDIKLCKRGLFYPKEQSSYSISTTTPASSPEDMTTIRPSNL